jgi:hypothetical protein
LLSLCPHPKRFLATIAGTVETTNANAATSKHTYTVYNPANCNR